MTRRCRERDGVGVPHTRTQLVLRVHRVLGLAIELDSDKATVPDIEEGVKGQDVLGSLSDIDKLR